MKNLRIISLKAQNSTAITATFTDPLATDLETSNVLIVSQTPNVPNPQILSLKVVGSTLEIETQPLTPLASYIFTFQSSLVRFRDLNGTAFLIEDGRINTVLLIGPEESTNPIFQNIQSYFRDNIYNIDDGTLTNDLLRMLANYIAKSLYDIRQIKNENYLSKTIVDESKTRGPGPYDRLTEEGAYEILRVARNRTGYSADSSIELIEMPSYLVSLRQTPIVGESLNISSQDEVGKINLNTLTMTVSNQNVITLTKVVFFYNSLLLNGNSYYEYDIEIYGYQLLDGRYDLDHGFKYLTLQNTQFRLSDKVLTDPNFSLHNISYISVDYSYKNLGRIVDPTSVTVTKDVSINREVVEPLNNIFNLKNFPILNSSGELATQGGVQFMDPNSNPSLSQRHPAFVSEIPFTFEALPSRIGDYSVDYQSGTVYVFGDTAQNQGTGAYPPLASYTYLYSYQPLIDYVYDSDEADIVALPDRELVGNEATINFSFQDTLVPGIDFNSNVHREVLTERAENRLYPNLNAIKVKNTPITNVFRIFNETQGQVYTPTRWNDDTIFFNFSTEPNVQTLTGERVTFQSVLNELLFVTQELTNNNSIRFFQIQLQNSQIISGTEDCIGASYNTSVIFSNVLTFIREVYFDEGLSIVTNLNRLILGDYAIDYQNGIVYVAVQTSKDYDIGTISYKRPFIQPTNSHILTPVDIYNRRNLLQPKDKSFAYRTFDEGSVEPQSFDFANERYLNNDPTLPYFVVNQTVGAFINGTFTPGVSGNIKYIRSLFEYNDLLFNSQPIDFSISAIPNDKTLDVGSNVTSSIQVVQKIGTQYYVNSGINLQYLSPNITMSLKVTRLIDGVTLWDNSGTYTLGQPMMLHLPGTGSPAAGDNVTVQVSLTINSASRVVVDYNRGELYLDYTYLADEIILSYEYGDNQLDFRQSTTVSENDEYFVTYRVGALRDALLKNFGTLIDIPLFTVFDESFERERYREAILAALSSFVEGPTIESMSRIVSTVTHIKPEINESIFENWSLGSSYLYPQDIKALGNPTLSKGRFGNGLLIKDPGQAVTLPLSSNLRLEEGTFSTWLAPKWNGLDNDATLTFIVQENNQYVIEPRIFIGAGEHHPKFNINVAGQQYFTVSKNDISKSPFGKPNKNKDGIYIYLDKDANGMVDGYHTDGYGYDGYHNSTVPTSATFYRWFVDIVRTQGAATYRFSVTSDGDFFDAKFLYPKNNTDSISSGTNKITFQTSQSQQGFSFLSDYDHYLLDFGSDDRNRVSIFKDAAGYLNLRVIDKEKRHLRLSADVSGWRANQNHHIAASWILNSKNEQDEMHFFIDGVEVPNIIRYGQGFPLEYGQKYRTVNPEEIVSLITRPIFSGDQMTTQSGSQVVTAPVNFTAEGILPGDLLFINELGFSSLGYVVSTVGTNSLTLASAMPLSITVNAKYTLNKTVIPVQTRIDIFPSTAVYLVHSYYTATDGVITGNQLTSASTNFVLAGVQVGNLIRVESEPEHHYVVTSLTSSSVTLNQTPTISGSSKTFYVYKNSETEIPGTGALLPYYQIGQDQNHNNQLTITNGASKGDLVRVKTFGLNFRSTRQNYYSWGSDGYVGSNIMHTRLPSPISLDDVRIRKVIFPTLVISSANSTQVGSSYQYTNSSIDQPILSDTGRTLEVTISGVNINFATPTTVQIMGTDSGGPATETLSFTAVGKKTTTHRFLTITSVVAFTTPTQLGIPAMTLGIKEAKNMMEAETSATVAKIRFSYQVRWGNTLSGSGSLMTDPNGFFASIDVGNYVHIFNGAGAGYYQILSVSTDHKSVTLSGSVPTFSNATYEVLNTTTARSGLQNGIFRFENAAQPGSVYPITKGNYEISYATYLSAKFDPLLNNIFVGSDIHLGKQINAVVDEVNIESTMMGDTRIGETVDASVGSLTSEFNALRRLSPKKTTLVLLHLEDGNVNNDAKFYVGGTQSFLQSGRSVNDNFDSSIIIKDRSVTVDNLGILNTKKEGSIEFWVSPLIDTANDPNYRFYFDASGNVSEEQTSSNRSTVTVLGNVNQVVSVRLLHGDMGRNYFGVGSVDSDRKTIRLQQNLPYQNTPVVVSYTPTGLSGDRISIYKDPYGFLTFNLRASGTDYQIRCPIFWTKNSWHRVKVTYKINGGKKQDEIHLFVDGFERGNVLFGAGLLFGQNLIYGQAFVGKSGIITTIKFTDSVNEFKIGSDYSGNHLANCLIDNLRISDISRPAYMAFGEPIDVQYNAQTGAAFPVTKDLFTTYLLDFDQLRILNEDYALLKNKNSGIFDFSLNIFDEFDIVKGSARVQEVLETLIRTLKPANSRVSINYK